VLKCYGVLRGKTRKRENIGWIEKRRVWLRVARRLREAMVEAAATGACGVREESVEGDAATVPATVVNWGGAETVGAEELVVYMSGLTGVPARFEQTAGAPGMLALDPTRRQQLTGKCEVDWRSGVGAALAAHFPSHLETATVQRRGNSTLGSEHSISARYQRPFTPRWILRMDAMKGWRQGRNDIFGARVELRCKF